MEFRGRFRAQQDDMQVADLELRPRLMTRSVMLLNLIISKGHQSHVFELILVRLLWLAWFVQFELPDTYLGLRRSQTQTCPSPPPPLPPRSPAKTDQASKPVSKTESQHFK